MAGMRDDDATNDAEFEVSRLDDVAPTAAPLDSAPTEDAPASGGAAPPSASRSVPENNLRPGRRLLQASVTGLAVALAVAIILVTVPNAASQLKAPLRLLTPEPTATLPLGSDIILLAHTVPWGHLRVDGRTDVARDLGIASGYHAYRLPPGQHNLDYTAESFPAVHCVVSAPARASDTCRASKNPNSIGEALRALDMNATVETMDNRERARLQALLENGASYPAITIEPGMHYLDQNGNSAIARERMTVTMSIGAVQPASDTDFNDNGQRCGEFCSLSQQDDPTAWNLLISIEQRWMYVAASGGSFMARSPADTAFTGAQVTWNNGEWALISDILSGSNCFFSRQFEYFDSIASKNGLSFSVIIAQPIPANGCVIEYSEASSSNQPKAQILYRLGVTLAVNADAHRLFPDLPVANAAERAIAQTIRAGQG
ncbi:MAG TPA: hypothetical protein VHR15_07270 [Ktedonobacterales bacterium]|jgi:hypothetical protein|nr:hypothetical protein [Ktedonobacterales bacterium]